MKNQLQHHQLTIVNFVRRGLIFIAFLTLFFFSYSHPATAEKTPEPATINAQGCALDVAFGATSDPISIIWGVSGFAGLWFLKKWIGC